MTNLSSGPAKAGPSPHHRLLALRVIPQRVELLATMTTVRPGELDVMAVGRCLQHVIDSTEVLLAGCTEHVQQVLDQDLEAWGEWVLDQLYDDRHRAVGERMLARYMSAYNAARDEFRLSEDTIVSAELGQVATGE